MIINNWRIKMSFVQIIAPCVHDSWVEFNQAWEKGSHTDRARLVLDKTIKIAQFLGILLLLAAAGYALATAVTVRTSEIDLMIGFSKSGFIALGGGSCIAIVLLSYFGKYVVGVAERCVKSAEAGERTLN
jgi:hypothetical protein